MNDSDDSRKQLKRSRTTAIVLASLTVLMLLFFVYGFIQKTNAEMVEVQLESCKQESEKLKQMIVLARLEADKQRAMAEASAKLAAENMMLAEKQLNESKKK